MSEKQPRETFNDYPVYSLSEVAMSLHRVVERTYPQPLFIKAEILKLNYYPHSGHCYPELVEKDGKKIKAEMRAIIWKSNFQIINQRFLQITGTPLKENINILCLASLEYSPTHGLALHIQDVEPSYTVGEMQRQRTEVIEKLKKEQVFANNKNLKFPLLPKRIAVISVETSKGFSDFISTLKNNRYGYCFESELFPSILQGDKAIVGITDRLSEIENRRDEFDCVVIVRGGGGDVGLSCYDDYTMAHRVATFPLPVLTGIGHSTNQSVTDMVAHMYKITPTDVAFALIDCFQKFDEKLLDMQTRILDKTRRVLAEEDRKLLDLDAYRKIVAPKILNQHKQALSQMSQMLTLRSKEVLADNGKMLETKQEVLKNLSKQNLKDACELLTSNTTMMRVLSTQLLQRKKDALELMEEKLNLLHPDNILKRGFSITRHNGKAVTKADMLANGDELITQVYQGEVRSVVK